MKSVSELNKMGIGVRFNENKLRYDLIPQEIIDELAKVFTFGAVKYDEENWKNFNEKQQKEIMASLLRHIYAHKKNEIFDKETGCTHLGHAACNIAFILHFLFKNKSREAYNLRFEEKLNNIISENQQEDTNIEENKVNVNVKGMCCEEDGYDIWVKQNKSTKIENTNQNKMTDKEFIKLCIERIECGKHEIESKNMKVKENGYILDAFFTMDSCRLIIDTTDVFVINYKHPVATEKFFTESWDFLHAFHTTMRLGALLEKVYEKMDGDYFNKNTLLELERRLNEEGEDDE